MGATTKNKEIASASAGQQKKPVAQAAQQPQATAAQGVQQPQVTAAQGVKQPQKNDSGVPMQQAYVESDAVKQAQALLQQQMAQKPGEYQSQWQTGMNDIMNSILNREKFIYDINSDALYQQYANQYINQGQMAMMDTMGQAAALTGGYGNSYAQSVGQQTYQGYLQQLNDKVPELYQLALNQYMQEGDALMNQYGLMADRENLDYGRYRDSVSDWNAEQNRLYQQYLDERNFDYGMYADDRDFTYQQGRDQVADQQWQAQFDESLRQYDEQFAYQQGRDQVADSQWEQSFQYQQDRDKISDSQWEQSFQYQQNQDKVSNDQWNQSFQYQQSQDKIANEQWQAQFDEAKRQFDYANGINSSNNSSNSSSSNSSSTSNKSYDTHGYSKAQIIALQKAAGITADGIWGPQTQKAYEAGYRPDDAPASDGKSGYYDQLLGAVSTAKGLYSKQDANTKQQAYKEQVAAINDAYKRGLITAEQKADLLRIATPSSR